MKLPILTPKELAGLDKFAEDRELFQELSADFDSSVTFFEAALDDDAWSRDHKKFLDQYVKWITNLYYADELDFGISDKIYNIFLKYHLQLEPFLFKDITIKVADKGYKANSIIAGHSSTFLRDQIRRASELGIKEVRLPEHHVKLAEYLFDSIRDLSGLGLDKLIEIAVSAHELGMEEVARASESSAARFLKEDNVFEIIKTSHRFSLNLLQKLSADFYSRLEKGFSLSSEGRDLIVIFHDLKVLTTFEQYKNLASIASGIGFRHDLGKDPEISSFIRLNPKIKTLDLSQTTSPIPWEGIPEKLQTLLLNRAEWLNAEELENLSKRFPVLRRLELEEVNYLSYDAYASLSLFTKVEELNLKGMRLGDTDLDLILSEMPGLRVISLSGLKKLNPRNVEKILGPLDLTRVDLSHTNADDALVTFLISRMRKLEELNVHSSSVSNSFIDNIRKRTKVKIIDSK